MKTRRVEREDGCVNHVPFVCNDDAVVFNRVADLPSHDQPELGAFGMIVPAILFIERRKILFVAVDDVRHGTIIVNEATA